MGHIGDAAQSNGDIMRRLRELERFVQELAAARKLENATIGKGGIRVDAEGLIRSTTFDGDLRAENPGTVGWALGADRLVLGGQFVSPLGYSSEDGEEREFAYTTTPTERATVTITVPQWARQAIVQTAVTAQAVNSRDVLDYLGIRIDIHGVVSGNTLFLPAWPFGDVSAGFVGGTRYGSRLITDLGSTVTTSALMHVNGGTWASHTNNFVDNHTSVLWLGVG